MLAAAKSGLKRAKEEFGVKNLFVSADRMNPRSWRYRVARETSVVGEAGGRKEDGEFE